MSFQLVSWRIKTNLNFSLFWGQMASFLAQLKMCQRDPPLHNPRVRLVCGWTPLCNFTDSYFSVTFWRTFSTLFFSRGCYSSCTLRMLQCWSFSSHEAEFWTVLTELTQKHAKKLSPNQPRTQPRGWNLQLSLLILRRKIQKGDCIFSYKGHLDWSRAAPLIRVARLQERFALSSWKQSNLADFLEQSILRIGVQEHVQCIRWLNFMNAAVCL